MADKLAAAFSLHKVELSCCNAEVNVKTETEEIPLPPEPPEETEFVVTNCSGQPIPEEIPCRKNSRKMIWKVTTMKKTAAAAVRQMRFCTRV